MKKNELKEKMLSLKGKKIEDLTSDEQEIFIEFFKSSKGEPDQDLIQQMLDFDERLKKLESPLPSPSPHKNWFDKLCDSI